MTNRQTYDIILTEVKERGANMALIKNGIAYDVLLLNVARSFGLESSEVLEFYSFIGMEKSDEEIQERYKALMG